MNGELGCLVFAYIQHTTGILVYMFYACCVSVCILCVFVFGFVFVCVCVSTVYTLYIDDS